MKNVSKKLFLITAITMIGCGPNYKFSSSFNSPSNSSISDPVTVPVVQEIPLSQENGTCSYSQSLLSCMTCPAKPAPVPLTKAQQLAQIMYLACQVPNKSAPAGYVPPTYDHIYNRLDSCTKDIYPQGIPTQNQQTTVDNLLGSSNSLRQKMFGGLWYQPPYSDYFETYFGVGVAEAVYSFCYQDSAITGILATKAYIDSMYGSSNLPIGWYKEFVDANIIRDELKSCIDQPGTAPLPGQPAGLVCEYKIFKGNNIKEALAHVQELLKNGYTLSVEANNTCVSIQKPSDAAFLEGNIVMAAMRCK
jgi:hypothetical protein